MAQEKRHPWMQTLNVAAVCPQCREPELRRSHARSFFERLIKDHTLRRPFRCHACGWRGWCDEASLTFPITPEKLQATRTIAADDTIPSFDLDTPPAAGRHFAPPDVDASVPGYSDAEIPFEPAAALPAAALPAAELPGLAAGLAPLTIPTADEQRLVTESQLSAHLVDDDFHSDDRHRSSACPRCGKMNLHRSHSRDLGEKLRKFTTLRRPYRCHSCGWRGWVRKD